MRFSWIKERYILSYNTQQMEVAEKIRTMMRKERLPEDKEGFEYAKELLIGNEQNSVKYIAKYLFSYLILFILIVGSYGIGIILDIFLDWVSSGYVSFNTIDMWFMLCLIVAGVIIEMFKKGEDNKLELLTIRRLKNMTYGRYMLLYKLKDERKCKD